MKPAEFACLFSLNREYLLKGQIGVIFQAFINLIIFLFHTMVAYIDLFQQNSKFYASKVFLFDKRQLKTKKLFMNLFIKLSNNNSSLQELLSMIQYLGRLAISLHRHRYLEVCLRF